MIRSKASTSYFWIIVLSTTLFASDSLGVGFRHPASSYFPKVKATSDYEDMVSTYSPYLKFVIEIGMQTDLSTAKSLADTFQKMQKSSPEAAAKFLKGLRFELLQKIELMGAASEKVSTQTPEMRKWVTRYLKVWLREAEEHSFRAHTQGLLTRAK